MRLEKKLTREDLAEMSSVHPNTIYRMETGNGVSLSIFERVVDALGYEVELMPKESDDA
jgi:transcriptional regulator with XRE-family HTH domain